MFGERRGGSRDERGVEGVRDGHLSFGPLYREEMDFKLQHGCDLLYEKLDAIGVTELLDLRRTNACARRFGWW